MRAVGFVPIGPEWPSCYFNAKLKLLLVVYVDDFKMSGTKENLAKGWGLLRKGLILENPKDVNGESYLGCRSHRKTVTLPSGAVAVINEYDMEEFFVSCVALYEELAPGVKLKRVATPFLSGS